MKKKLLVILSVLIISAMVLAACGPTVEETPVVEDQPEEETEADEADEVEEEVSDEPVEIRWFVGLGAGSDEPTFAPQQAVVDRFNASQDEIVLVLEIIDADSAVDTLATQIAAGNSPDIAGPVGVKGRDAFKGAWLDLADLIEANDYDLSDFDDGLVKFYNIEGEGQIGIPFGIFPSFILYNADLFDEAGLNYPPAAYGEPYVMPDGTEVEWNMDTLKEIAMILTVDINGNDATMDEFDTENIVQFGFENLWTDARGKGTFFGAGSFTDENGDAQIPEPWLESWKWQYDGMWKDWFIPNGAYGGADFLQGPGGSFSTGNMGMIHIHMWYVAGWALGDAPFTWNIAATPAYNGVVTSKMHADTFGILKGTEHPQEAFEVLTYLLSSETAEELLNIYGGMPARLSLQGDYFTKYGESNFPGLDLNFDVVAAGAAYADNPNHESWMPSFQETTDRYNEFFTYLSNTPDLDVEAEAAILLEDLQAIFDAAE